MLSKEISKNLKNAISDCSKLTKLLVFLALESNVQYIQVLEECLSLRIEILLKKLQI